MNPLTKIEIPVETQDKIDALLATLAKDAVHRIMFDALREIAFDLGASPGRMVWKYADDEELVEIDEDGRIHKPDGPEPRKRRVTKKVTRKKPPAATEGTGQTTKATVTIAQKAQDLAAAPRARLKKGMAILKGGPMEIVGFTQSFYDGRMTPALRAPALKMLRGWAQLNLVAEADGDFWRLTELGEMTLLEME